MNHEFFSETAKKSPLSQSSNIFEDSYTSLVASDPEPLTKSALILGTGAAQGVGRFIRDENNKDHCLGLATLGGLSFATGTALTAAAKIWGRPVALAAGGLMAYAGIASFLQNKEAMDQMGKSISNISSALGESLAHQHDNAKVKNAIAVANNELGKPVTELGIAALGGLAGIPAGRVLGDVTVAAQIGKALPSCVEVADSDGLRLNFASRRHDTDHVLDYLVHEKLAPKVQEIKFFGSEVTDEGLSKLESFPNLKKLDLVGASYISPEGLKVIPKLSSLKELDLFGVENLNANQTMDLVAPLKQMEDLSFPSVPQDTAALERLQNMQTLKRLSINVDDHALQYVGKLKNLEELQFQSPLIPGHELTDAGLENLAGLQKLKKLGIGHDKPGVTQKGIDFVSKLPSIQRIWFENKSYMVRK